MTAPLYRWPKERKRAKYGAVATVVDGYRFDSKSEARHYEVLRCLERTGQITGLVVHPRFPLVVMGQRVGTYVADMMYTEAGKQIVVDVKGVRTPLYRLKAKLLRALYGITITEVAA